MTAKRTHVVSISSGVGSAVAARLVLDRYGPEATVLLFADVNGEDPDNYRFLDEVLAWLKADTPDGPRFVRLDNAGRTIWDTFREARFLGNSRVDPCSRILKREPMRRWLEDNYTPETATMHIGFDISEGNRLDRARPHWEPWTVDAPLCWDPPVWKDQAVEMLAAAGIEPPSLTRDGFPHANCGGGCIKAGHKQFRKLLAERPEVYAEWEREEEGVRVFLGRSDVAILRDRRGGKSTPMTLADFRKGYEGPEDESSCSCMGYVADVDEEANR